MAAASFSRTAAWPHRRVRTEERDAAVYPGVYGGCIRVYYRCFTPFTAVYCRFTPFYTAFTQFYAFYRCFTPAFTAVLKDENMR